MAIHPRSRLTAWLSELRRSPSPSKIHSTPLHPVRNIAMAKSGFVFSSTTYIEQDRQYAQLTLRVPADRFDETIAELRGAPLGK